jgi:hypothetical protein
MPSKLASDYHKKHIKGTKMKTFIGKNNKNKHFNLLNVTNIISNMIKRAPENKTPSESDNTSINKIHLKSYTNVEESKKEAVLSNLNPRILQIQQP